MIIHDFKCTECGTMRECTVHPETESVECDFCAGVAWKTFENFKFREHLQFPEGPWHCLKEVDGHPPEIRSRRQLREQLKIQATDDHSKSYAKYDDGIAGY